MKIPENIEHFGEFATSLPPFSLPLKHTRIPEKGKKATKLENGRNSNKYSATTTSVSSCNEAPLQQGFYYPLKEAAPPASLRSNKSYASARNAAYGGAENLAGASLQPQTQILPAIDKTPAFPSVCTESNSCDSYNKGYVKASHAASHKSTAASSNSRTNNIVSSPQYTSSTSQAALQTASEDIGEIDTDQLRSLETKLDFLEHQSKYPYLTDITKSPNSLTYAKRVGGDEVNRRERGKDGSSNLHLLYPTDVVGRKKNLVPLSAPLPPNFLPHLTTNKYDGNPFKKKIGIDLMKSMDDKDLQDRLKSNDARTSILNQIKWLELELVDTQRLLRKAESVADLSRAQNISLKEQLGVAYGAHCMVQEYNNELQVQLRNCQRELLDLQKKFDECSDEEIGPMELIPEKLPVLSEAPHSTVNPQMMRGKYEDVPQNEFMLSSSAQWNVKFTDIKASIESLLQHLQDTAAVSRDLKKENASLKTKLNALQYGMDREHNTTINRPLLQAANRLRDASSYEGGVHPFSLHKNFESSHHIPPHLLHAADYKLDQRTVGPLVGRNMELESSHKYKDPFLTNAVDRMPISNLSLLLGEIQQFREKWKLNANDRIHESTHGCGKGWDKELLNESDGHKHTLKRKGRINRQPDAEPPYVHRDTVHNVNLTPDRERRREVRHTARDAASTWRKQKKKIREKREKEEGSCMIDKRKSRRRREGRRIHRMTSHSSYSSASSEQCSFIRSRGDKFEEMIDTYSESTSSDSRQEATQPFSPPYNSHHRPSPLRRGLNYDMLLTTQSALKSSGNRSILKELRIAAPHRIEGRRMKDGKDEVRTAAHRSGLYSEDGIQNSMGTTKARDTYHTSDSNQMNRLAFREKEVTKLRESGGFSSCGMKASKTKRHGTKKAYFSESESDRNMMYAKKLTQLKQDYKQNLKDMSSLNLSEVI